MHNPFFFLNTKKSVETNSSSRSVKRGFTILELLISIAILAILMVATTEVFAKSFSSYQSTKRIENSITDAQFLMNLLSKELRTSTIVAPSSEGETMSIKFYEHSKSECVQYRFNGSSGFLEVARSSAGSSFSSCDNSSDLSGFSAVGVGTLAGSFYSVPSEMMTPGPGRVGRVTTTISFDVTGANDTVLQTTTSLRDYGQIGLQ